MRRLYPDISGTTLYSAPIIFDRNAHLVPAAVRVADILWGAAGMSGLYTGSSIRPPTSVYSLGLILADKVGGWDTDRGAIGEDLHMYLKCFFAMNGNLTTRTILAPVSQTSVSSGIKGINASYQDCRARYKQALRHMLGAMDSGYALRQMADVVKGRRSSTRNYAPMHGTRYDSPFNVQENSNIKVACAKTNCSSTKNLISRRPITQIDMASSKM